LPSAAKILAKSKIDKAKQVKSVDQSVPYSLKNQPIESQAAQAHCKRTQMCFLVLSALYLQGLYGNANLSLYRCTVKNVNRTDFFFHLLTNNEKKLVPFGSGAFLFLVNVRKSRQVITTQICLVPKSHPLRPV